VDNLKGSIEFVGVEACPAWFWDVDIAGAEAGNGFDRRNDRPAKKVWVKRILEPKDAVNLVVVESV
jgi:hypothetical protein